MILTDTALLLLYLGYASQIPAFWTTVLRAGVLLIISLTTISLLTMFARALFAPRKLTPLSNNTQAVLGRPLLFPATLRHMRLSPVKDKFSNRFLIAGIPVGLHCRFGNLLAIDDASLDVSPAPGDYAWSWKRTFASLSCWFSIDAVRLLHRGDHGVDLRGKLDRFLRAENEDPAQWPYAYLLTVPKFLVFSRNVVTWWYLYTEKRELDALILEINNSYNEKRNILLRVRPNSDRVDIPPTQEDLVEYLDNQQLVRSLPTATRAKFYSGEWHKYIFASPFEKVDGVVSQRMMDPLNPNAWKPNASFSNMTTLEETGAVRMATRVTCNGPPIDPTQTSTWETTLFLLQWTFPGMFTTLEIIFTALRIRFSGAMKMNSKPPVRSGSVARHITKMEMDLEPFFRAYLAHCVETHPNPIQVTYRPCRSFANDTIHLHSPSSYGHSPSSPGIRKVTIEPTDPALYTRVLNYEDIKTALIHETKLTGHTADPTAQRLLVSDLPLLISILEHNSQKGNISPSPQLGKSATLLAISRRVCFVTPSFMDDFVLSLHDPSSRAVYVSSVPRVLAARRLAFSSQTLLDVYIFLASCLVRWILLTSLFSVAANTNSLFSSHQYQYHRQWISSAIAICGYLLTLGVWVAVKGRVLRSYLK